MARYIDADVLKRNIRVNLMPNVDVDGTVTVENAERYFLNIIDKTSTADVEEVKHGEWKPTKIPAYFGGVIYECSLCGAKDGDHTKILGRYCWRCGAKMDGGKTE